ncbi:MAG TPA: lysylphosphatidylglycerol synthase transmembrane domain-containing protein [Thermoanaerobaculia bacterium]|jgi:uncharacterized protein (TIRG00374 family)
MPETPDRPSEIAAPASLTPVSRAPEPRARLRHALGVVAKAAIALAALYIAWRLAAGIRWSDLAARLAGASWTLVALAVLFLAVRFAAWDLRFRLAAARVTGGRSRAPFGFSVLLASAALNLLNPAARLLGGPLRARHFARATGRSFGLFYGIVLYDQLVHQATISLCTVVSLAAVALAAGHRALGWGAYGLLAAVAGGLVLWSRKSGPFAGSPLARFLARRAARQDSRLQRLYVHGQEAVSTFVSLVADRGMGLRAVALGGGLFLANAVAQWLVFRALGESVGVLPVIAVVALGNAAGMLMGTPGGIGTTEATMVAAYVALGVDRVSAGAATLLFRGLHYALVIAVGGPALVGLEVKAALSAAKKPAAEARRRRAA